MQSEHPQRFAIKTHQKTHNLSYTFNVSEAAAAVATVAVADKSKNSCPFNFQQCKEKANKHSTYLTNFLPTMTYKNNFLILCLVVFSFSFFTTHWGRPRRCMSITVVAAASISVSTSPQEGASNDQYRILSVTLIRLMCCNERRPEEWEELLKAHKAPGLAQEMNKKKKQ